MHIPPELTALLRQNEALAPHTSFKTGGPADWYIQPPAVGFACLAKLALQFAREHELPVFILGGGTNLCISDNGIRGFVLDTSLFRGFREEKFEEKRYVRVLCGTPSDTVARFCQERALGGLEFLAGLPGCTGGAVAMNARCFERSVNEVVQSVQYLDDDTLTDRTLEYEPAEWGYKKSPFQHRLAGHLIRSVLFKAYPSREAAIAEKCGRNRGTREGKGHFRFPSAGSVFKNNRKFGRTSGAIIEELGLRGRKIGGAQIAPWHGNFIINTGGATSADIRALVELAKSEARSKLGLELEEEIIFAGTW